MTDSNTNSAEVGPVKKSYQRPQLLIYGNLRDITRHMGETAKVRDNPPTNTHLFKSLP